MLPEILRPAYPVISDWAVVHGCSQLFSAVAVGSDGLLDRLRGRRGSLVSARVEPLAASVSLLDGQDDLEVVGELAYQSALWRLCGGTVGERVRHDIVAVLVSEPANPYDANAVAVQVDGQVVGYLPRATAQQFQREGCTPYRSPMDSRRGAAQAPPSDACTSIG